MRVTFYEGTAAGEHDEVGHIELTDAGLIGVGVGERIMRDPPKVIQPGTLAALQAHLDPMNWLESLPSLFRDPHMQAFLQRTGSGR